MIHRNVGRAALKIAFNTAGVTIPLITDNWDHFVSDSVSSQGVNDHLEMPVKLDSSVYIDRPFAYKYLWTHTIVDLFISGRAVPN